MGFFPAALVGSQLLSNPVTVAQGGTGLTSSPITLALGGTGATTLAGAQQGLIANLLPWEPPDAGFLAATAPLDGFSGATAALTAGTVYLVKCVIRQAFTWTNVNYIVAGAGSGASTGSFCGLYNSSGTLLSSSADIGANLAAAATYSTALTSAQALAAGTFVWVALLSNLATTQPTMRIQSTPSAVTVNIGLAASVFRCATNGTGQTTLPASITPSANAGSAVASWFAAS